MIKKLTVAILGSTGYVGLELVKILSRHPNILINFLGSENSPNQKISDFDSSLKLFKLPNIDLNINFNPKNSDVVFLALPHGISHKYVKNFFEQKISDRTVVVFIFNENETIELISQYDLNDEQDVKNIKDTTPNELIKRGLIEKIFGGIGNNMPTTTE